MLQLFQPQNPLPKTGSSRPLAPAIKAKQKALFYLAHTKNPYLKNIRTPLNRFLLITEPERQEKENSSTELTFSDIVDKVIHQSHKRYPDLKITSDLKADIELPFCANMIFQALWELLKNAQQASPADEAIRIRTDSKGDSWFCCEVEDKGPGMNRELMEKASQLYWTTKADSTGLGLAFVQSALSRMGGIMKLKSPTGGGLTVQLFIPKDYLFHIQNLTSPNRKISMNRKLKPYKSFSTGSRSERGVASTVPPRVADSLNMASKARQFGTESRSEREVASTVPPRVADSLNMASKARQFSTGSRSEREVASTVPPRVAGFRNALVSVSDKTGLVDFISPLARGGMRVVATGGTAQLLKNAGIAVVDLSEQTGFNEVMDGRVKSLHPRIYMPLLARLNHLEDQKALEREGLHFFDLVVCNLYPFLKKKEEGESHLADWIDVGGPAMLRASAKNFERITVVCDPVDYPWILQEGVPSLEKRRVLAGKAFSLLAEYNHHIAHWLTGSKSATGRKPTGHKPTDKVPPISDCDPRVAGGNHPEGDQVYATPFMDRDPVPSHKEIPAGHFVSFAGMTLTKKDLHLKAHFFKQLRYGENPHQKATWFQLEKAGLHSATQLQGKELSFNNISDLNSAVSLLRELDDPSVVVVKHNNPCGVACDTTMEVALNKALKADPVSVFGGIVALNGVVSEESAQLIDSLFLEAIIATDYSDSALSLFKSKKKNLRILRWPDLSKKDKQKALSFRSVTGGLLVQEQIPTGGATKWQFMRDKPSLAVLSDGLLAWKVASHLKSNAIALVSKQQTIGLGMGHVNRVSAVEMAIKNYQYFHPQATELVMASDGFFPFSDSIELAGREGIKWVIQPGGSVRDKEVMAKAEELNINMILTGQRGFSH